MSQALDRIRHVAKHRKKKKFTALFHHITVQLLREAFFELEENAGVDGLRWGNTRRISNTGSKICTHDSSWESYRALPGPRGYIPKLDGRLRPLAVAALERRTPRLPQESREKREH